MPAIVYHDGPSKSGPDSVSDRPCSKVTSKCCGRSLYRVPEEQESIMTLETEATLAADDSDPESGWDKELEQRGLYRGSYRGYLALYTLSPFTAFVTFVFLALLPSLVYPVGHEQWKDKYPPLVPFPLPELLTSIAFSSLSHLLRTPVFSLASLVSSLSIFENSQYASYVTVLTSCALYTIAALFLRLCSFALLLPSANSHNVISSDPAISTRDPGFRIAWWTGLGWAIAEATVAIAQGYSSISLYKDVLVSVHHQNPKIDNPVSSILKEGNGKGKQSALPPGGDDVPAAHPQVVTYGACSPSHFEQASSSATAVAAIASTDTETQPLLRQGSNLSVVTSSSFASLSLHPSVAWDHPTAAAAEEGDTETEESELQVQVDRDIDHLLAFRRREELEELYGMPFIKIPVFLSCLHRVNAFLQSVGFSLLLGAAYIYASPSTNRNAPSPHFVWFLVLSTLGVHVFLTVLHTPLLLPKLGVHTVVYVNSMIALGTLFVGLAVWGGVS
ncbi:hypothetical protein JOM56_011230 [Amanita muscaria]